MLYVARCEPIEIEVQRLRRRRQALGVDGRQLDLGLFPEQRAGRALLLGRQCVQRLLGALDAVVRAGLAHGHASAFRHVEDRDRQAPIVEAAAHDVAKQAGRHRRRQPLVRPAPVPELPPAVASSPARNRARVALTKIASKMIPKTAISTSRLSRSHQPNRMAGVGAGTIPFGHSTTTVSPSPGRSGRPAANVPPNGSIDASFARSREPCDADVRRWRRGRWPCAAGGSVIVAVACVDGEAPARADDVPVELVVVGEEPELAIGHIGDAVGVLARIAAARRARPARKTASLPQRRSVNCSGAPSSSTSSMRKPTSARLPSGPA